MSNFTRGINRLGNPSINQQLPGQVRNDAGGFVYKMSDMDRLMQFLILGTTNSHYVDSETMLVRNIADVYDIAFREPNKTLDTIAEVNLRGNSQKHSALILAAAMLLFHPDGAIRHKAKNTLIPLIRTGYHALTYLNYINALRNFEKEAGRNVGFGRAKTGVLKSFIENQSSRSLVLLRIKYHNRDGRRLEDIFNFAHPNLKKVGREEELIGRWIMDNLDEKTELALQWLADEGSEPIRQIIAWAKINNSEITTAEAAKLIRNHQLPREAVPTHLLKSVEVWQALLPSMPIHALIRNLSVMINNGTADVELDTIMERLSDIQALKRQRVIPMDILKAWGVLKGNPKAMQHSITAQLEQTFFDLLKIQDKVNANVLVAVDVSGSMGIFLNDSNRGGIKAIQAATGMAFAFQSAFTNVDIIGFDYSLHDIHNKRTLDEDSAWHDWGGGTAPSLITSWMKNQPVNYDAVIFITDNDAWIGQHAQAEMQKYRAVRNLNTVMMVNATASQGYSLADSTDPLSLDMPGFNSNVIEVLQWKLASIRKA